MSAAVPDEGAPSADGAKAGAWRKVIAPAVAAAIAFVILVGLGIWQLERLAWKAALIARVEAGLASDPIAAPGPDAWAALDMAATEYQPVTLRGAFDHAKEVHVVHALTSPKGPLGGLGYQVFTPLRTDEGWWVYVNRGFVPRENRDPVTRSSGQIEGETTVVGLLRGVGSRSWFTPGDNVAGNEWFSRDPALFATAAGLPAGEVAPYLVDARFDPDLPGGLPQGGETLVSFPNNHLQYAVTWFGLAAGAGGCLLGVHDAAPEGDRDVAQLGRSSSSNVTGLSGQAWRPHSRNVVATFAAVTPTASTTAMIANMPIRRGRAVGSNWSSKRSTKPVRRIAMPKTIAHQV